MATSTKPPHTGKITPEDLADPTAHRQTQPFETDNRPDSRSADLPAGDPAGPDTSGAVAHPAEIAKPGASAKLGGSPGANATQSRGRTGDYDR